MTETIISFLFLAGAFVLLLIGLIGTFLPVLPGPPIAWCGLLLAYFSKFANIPFWALLVTAVVMVAVTVADYVFPSMFTKKTGGSKAAERGTIIGTIIGLFVGPLGVIAGPFIGAYVGELIHDDTDNKHALEVAFGAFKGFMLGTGIKLLVVTCFIAYLIVAILLNPSKPEILSAVV
ncbi:DUF456 domain-containing protein [Treponema zioleckii]|uniref:DUF456 domain-containing protein n=1 Tax=Treponema zioleckii TaxID=331680 RepID=UPI00168B2DCD|nr:DUF456 domain-containing protein [Treponema zioleckii]